MKPRLLIVGAIGLGLSVVLNIALIAFLISQRPLLGLPVPPPGTKGFSKVAQKRIQVVMARIVQEPERREKIMDVVRHGLVELETGAEAMRGNREQGLDLMIRNPDLPLPDWDQDLHLRVEQTITSAVRSVTRLMTAEEREELIKEIRRAGKPGRF